MKLRLISALFLFIIPVILIFLLLQLHFNWQEYSNWSEQLSAGQRDSNRKRLAEIGLDPIFTYYFTDKERASDPLYISSHYNTINTLFRELTGMDSTRYDDHIPISLGLYDSSGSEIIRVGVNRLNVTAMVDQLRQSQAVYLEQVFDGEQYLLFPLGLDRNKDGKLSGNERKGYLLGHFRFANEHYEALALTHMQQDILRALALTLLLILMTYLAARYLARPINQLMSRLHHSSQGEWIELDTSTHIIEINHLGQLLNEQNAELHEKNSSLSEARDLALHLADVKGQFLAAISHELRTPINGIIGFTHLLSQEQLNQVQHHYLENIATSAKTLHALIDDVLDFSRIQAGRLELECEDFDLLSVIEDCLMIVSHSTQSKGLELLRYYSADAPVMLRGDRTRVSQVLLNLLNNAVKFTESGTIFLSAQCVSRDETGERFQFTLKDTGIGIEQSHLATIFQPFVQSDSSIQRRFGGSGLGLAITKQLVELMQGSIEVESTLHVGSTFTFSLLFGASKLHRAELPQLHAGGECSILLHAMDRASRDTINNSFALSDLTPENLDQPNRFIQQVIDQTASAKPVLACIGGAYHQLQYVNQLLQQLSQQRQVLNGNTRFLLFTEDISLSHLNNSSLINQAAILPKSVSRRVLIETINSLYNAEQRMLDESAHLPTGGAALDGYSILIVDDNEINLQLVHQVLQECGATTTCASDAMSAINYTKSSPFDLILMDVQMPGMSGIEATRCIRQLDRHTNTLILALTANVTEEGYKACLQAGMNDVVTKPFDPQQLVQLIKSHSSVNQQQ